MPVMPAVWLSLGEEANIGVWLPWPWEHGEAQWKLSGSLCSEPGMYWGVHWFAPSSPNAL